MTEPTARERLSTALALDFDWQNESFADCVLRHLPLVLEAAREAGKAERANAGGFWPEPWPWLSDPEEQT